MALVTCAWWSVALALVVAKALGFPGFEDALTWKVPLLMFAGSQWLSLTLAAFAPFDKNLGVRDVPLNVELVAHRMGEFTMLMLGEGILQLCVAPWPVQHLSLIHI